MKPIRMNIEVFRGETLLKEITLSDPSGTAIDLVGLTISGTVRRSYTDTSSGTDLHAQIVTPASGTISFGLTEDETENSTITNGVYDVFLQDPAVNRRMCLLYGTFVILPAATRFV